MTGALLLDTHIALWLDSGNSRLHPSTQNRSARVGEMAETHLSAVTAWEIALPGDTRRIALDVPVEAWMQRFLARPGFAATPPSVHAASRAYRLHHLEHRDPADRLLTATAIEPGCPLVTYDECVTRFGERHGGQYRFTTLS